MTHLLTTTRCCASRTVLADVACLESMLAWCAGAELFCVAELCEVTMVARVTHLLTTTRCCASRTVLADVACLESMLA
ncbi:hypothetical protein ACNQTB_12355, partial [Corynebacterium diphtheriae]